MNILKCKICLIALSLFAMEAANAQRDSFACDYATDIDQDNDGLIEICDLEGLDAIRYQADGTGYRTSTDTTKITIGCKAGGCNGYELVRDLDFNDDASYSSTANKVIYTVDDYEDSADSGWQPIGYYTDDGDDDNDYQLFNSLFEGNGHTISNLMINRSDADYAIGLFGYTGGSSEISNIGLLNVDIYGDWDVGGVVGRNNGSIMNSYATGSIDGGVYVGGLVGRNTGSIANGYATGSVDGGAYTGGLAGSNNSGSSIAGSYATGSVYGDEDTGGLVGLNAGSITNGYATGYIDGYENTGGLVGQNTGNITNNYATGSVDGVENTGGLVGLNTGSAANSYWDTETSEISTSAAGLGKTTAELQSPTTVTGIYSEWSTDDWDFGSASQYPVLKSENADILSSILRYGLSRLQLTEGHLSPDFIAVLPNYTGTVVSSTNTIQLIPTAINLGARIRIDSDNIHDDIASGAASSEITLNTVGITTITISVINNGVTIKYNLQVDYYRFSGDIDKDGDGLIEVDNLEKLNLIRYQADGTGYRKTSTDPKVTIGCPEDGCKGYELTGNLDLSEDENWLPIDTFTGIFEGGGYTISNLTINRPNANGVGLFFSLESGSEINNIGLLNVDVKGNRVVGSLAGWNSGRITNSYATGFVDGDDYVGGLVGRNSSGSIAGSYATGSIDGDENVGGLVGRNGSGTITNSYAIGFINGRSAVGGLVGQNTGSIAGSYATGFVDGNANVGGLVGQNTGSIAGSYATSSIDGDENVGGLVGRNNVGTIAGSYATGSVHGWNDVGGLVGWNNVGSITSSYWDKDATGISTSAAGIGKTTAALQSPTTATGIYSMWSSNDWDFGSASQYPVLRDENGDLLSPILRYGLSRLRLAEGHLSPDFIASAANYTGTVVNSTSTIHLIPTAINPDTRIRIKSGEIHDKIASGSTSSKITLNTVGITTITIVVIGSELTIKYNLNINYYRFSGDIDKDGDGLIEVDNLEGLNAIRYQTDGTGYRKTSTSPKVTIGCPADGCIGYELTGNLDLSAIENWLPINAFAGVFEGNGHTISNLTINRPATNYVGLFGDIERGSEISNIGLLNVDLKGLVAVGGLIGTNRGTITNSYAIGSIDGDNDVGGLVGWNRGSIINSYASGSVNGNGIVGGLVGLNGGSSIFGVGGVSGGGSITNSYATDSVNGADSVGGLVGTNRGSIANSYAGGSVDGKMQAGGLVGLNNEGSVANSYWDTDASGISISAGGTGKTTVELKSPTAAVGIYSSWSSDNWHFGTSALPMLKYSKACITTTEESINQPVCGALLPSQDVGSGIPEVSPDEAARIRVRVFLEGFLQ